MNAKSGATYRTEFFDGQELGTTSTYHSLGGCPLGKATDLYGRVTGYPPLQGEGPSRRLLVLVEWSAECYRADGNRSVPMPVISYFFGIYVRMYHDDHPPPHIHVEYQGHEAFVAISTGEILEGELPKAAARLVKDWCAEHRAELAANWARAQALEPLERIPGADQ